MSTKKAIMRAAIWAAVSSKAQAADDKVSIPLQLQLGHEHAEKNNWLVTHQLVLTYSLDFSRGSTSKSQQ